MNVTTLTALLGDWAESGRPMSSALADRLSTLIRDGDLPLDTALPSERILADALGLSRTTVTAAYDRIKASGLADSWSGRGTWISRRDRPHASDAVPGYGVASQVLYADSGNYSAEVFDLTWAAPRPGSWLDEALLPASQDLICLAATHTGYEPAGIPSLRAKIAAHFSSAIRTSPDQIVVTSGGTQAISLLLRALASPGTTVLVEELTCPTVLAVFRNQRVKVVPLAMDHYGITTRELEHALRCFKPSLVYLTPTFHNPTGGTLPSDRRQAIVDITRKYQIPIVEDLTLADLSLGDDPPKPLAAHAGASHVYSIGSLSKLYWPGLRVGWIRLPTQHPADLTGLKAVDDFGTSLDAQTLAGVLLEQHDSIQHYRRSELTMKRDHLLAQLHHVLPEWEAPSPNGGLSLWVKAPEPVERLRQYAMRHCVILLTDEHFRAAVTLEPPEHIRLPYTMDSERLTDLVHRISRAWDASARK